ncbi:hypothetical protein P872_14235 [Rhodonellum psychrophilum GCM71 = DSM 17998]|uniref:Uncharacterized protein n=1 Tax=Rhodonellum psychrophilum GCM71 = DSM 17998 TaxID=1123057 RepID=U5BUG0_9BACT|nr:hypothetical protein P872_14235 [Rhodonellum psychrophilum GCM71 = DSM 17998]
MKNDFIIIGLSFKRNVGKQLQNLLRLKTTIIQTLKFIAM